MSTEPVTHLEQVVAGTTTPVTHLEQVVAGTATPVTHLEHVISENSGGGSATLIEKTVTQNGVYNAADDSADGYSKVTANVPNTYAAGDEGKVVSSGALVAQSSDTVTSNGTVDTTLINSLTVDVQVSVPFYSGTLTLASRPAATGTFATLDAPNCTHFAMYAGNTPDLATDKAFWGFAFVEKDQATFVLASNNAGTGIAASAGGKKWSFDSQTDLVGITLVFGENSIELLATNVGDTARLPQAGLDYKWFAW